MSTRLVTNMANTPAGKASKHANPPRFQHFGAFSTNLDRRFLLSDEYYCPVAGHPAPTSPGLALNHPILSRISPKSAFGKTMLSVLARSDVTQL